MRVRRRDFLKGIGGLALAAPAVAQPARTRTLRYAPRSDLASLDPVLSTAASTASHGFCVYDQLYGVDDQYRARPQMAEGHSVSDDGLTWLIKLRPGLMFHNGAPVLARDCAASLARWTKRDTFGLNLAARVETFDSTDDRTLRIKLTRPFPVLLDAIGHSGSSPPFIMPEHVAKTDPRTPITDTTGSGPLRFVADEHLAGSRVVYTKFDGYVPRDEPAEQTSGGKRVFFDRVEWNVIPDDATASAALQNNEIDWWEVVQPDLLPMLAKDKAITLAVADRYGSAGFMQFNCQTSPFNNVQLRRIVMEAVDQKEYMSAVAGDFPGAWRTCYSMYTCGLAGVQEVGAEVMAPKKDYGRLRDAVSAVGYNGEKVVVLNATDYNLLAPMGRITADILGKLGFNVELQELDFGTVMQRRGSRQPVANGGWSIFHGLCISPIGTSPPQNMYVQGQGAAGWFGWFDSPEIVSLQAKWIESGTEAERMDILNRMQTVAFDLAPAVPLGQFFSRTAFRSDLSGFLPSAIALMWNMQRG